MKEKTQKKSISIGLSTIETFLKAYDDLNAVFLKTNSGYSIEKHIADINGDRVVRLENIDAENPLLSTCFAYYWLLKADLDDETVDVDDLHFCTEYLNDYKKALQLGLHSKAE